jgi:hypothetical protein
MFDPKLALKTWRDGMVREGRLSPAQVAELEAHLLDAFEAADQRELSPEERFLIATHRIGRPVELGHEYGKLTPWATWRLPMFWAAVGVAWVLGATAILDTGIPLGALVASRLELPFGWLKAWAFIVYVGGPLVAFAAVGAWMRRFSASDPISAKALFTTVTIAALLRLAATPIQGGLHRAVWRAFDPAAVRSFQTYWQVATAVGVVLVAIVGAVVLVRFRRDLREGGAEAA